jgi:hypothetical protein
MHSRQQGLWVNPYQLDRVHKLGCVALALQGGLWHVTRLFAAQSACLRLAVSSLCGLYTPYMEGRVE